MKYRIDKQNVKITSHR